MKKSQIAMFYSMLYYVTLYFLFWHNNVLMFWVVVAKLNSIFIYVWECFQPYSYYQTLVLKMVRDLLSLTSLLLILVKLGSEIVRELTTILSFFQIFVQQASSLSWDFTFVLNLARDSTWLPEILYIKPFHPSSRSAIALRSTF